MKINSTQRAVSAVAVPILVLIATIAIAKDSVSTPGFLGNPWDLSQTGHIWFISVTLIALFEFLLFRDQTK